MSFVNLTVADSGGYNGQNHSNNRYGYNTGLVSINLYTDTSNDITEGKINTMERL